MRVAQIIAALVVVVTAFLFVGVEVAAHRVQRQDCYFKAKRIPDGSYDSCEHLPYRLR